MIVNVVKMFSDARYFFAFGNSGSIVMDVVVMNRVIVRKK